MVFFVVVVVLRVFLPVVRVSVVRHHVDYDDSVLFSPWYAGVARFTGLYVFVDGVDVLRVFLPVVCIS